MAIRVTCPNGHVLKVKEKYAGQTGLCPHCQARLLVPALDDDAILDMIGPPTPEEAGDGLPVHQDPRHHAGASSASETVSNSGMIGSSIIASKTKSCPKCHQHVNARFDFCPNCGLYFTNWDEIGRRFHQCGTCGSPFVPGDTSCRECGTALSAD